MPETTAVPVPVIAVDGPSGSGKSSASRRVAATLGCDYVDTGAMYRAMTWWMLEKGIPVEDPEAVAQHVAQPRIAVVPDPGEPGISVDGIDVAVEIRRPEVSAAVSAVSAVPEVRARLVGLQRDLVAASVAAGRGIVMEGRDIGTVVLPQAPVKIFLTADAQARAERRAAEDAARGTAMGETEGGGGAALLEATEAHLRQRDARDSTRSISPLVAADDAVVVDATHVDLEGVVAAILAVVAGRDPGPGR